MCFFMVQRRGLFVANQKDNTEVLNALNKSWESLVGNPVSFAAVEASAPLDPMDHFFFLELTLADGGKRQTILEIPPRCLVELSSRMFGEPLSAADTAKCADAGRELCNILGACCIKLFQNPDGCETGLPRSIGAAAARSLVGAGSTRYRFAVDHAGECLSLSIVGEGA